MKTLYDYKFEYARMRASDSKDVGIEEEIWIYMQWTKDNDTNPGTGRYALLMSKEQEYNPDLFAVLSRSHARVAAVLGRRRR